MNTEATGAFMTKTAKAQELIAIIQAEVDDHMGTNPQNVNWGHVGDANHVLESLRDIARFMGHVE